MDIARLTEELTVRRLRVRVCDVVYVKAILEASEGLAIMLAERQRCATVAKHERFGELVFATAPSRTAELDCWLDAMAIELAARERLA